MNTTLLSELETRIHPMSGISNIPSQMMLPRTDIKLLSYNIFMRPPPVKNKVDDYKNQRLEDIIRHLHQFDIVCFQESFGVASIRKKAIISYAQRLGFFFFVKSPEPSFFSPFLCDGGLLVLSRFPIVKSDFVNFRSRQDSDAVPMKGVAYAKILIDNTKYLHLFTTHTQASYHSSGSKKRQMKAVDIRMEQFRIAGRFISKMTRDCPPEDLIILCGDLNEDSHECDPKDSAIMIDPSEKSINYKRMLSELGNNGEFQILDIIHDCCHQHPATYGGIFFDKAGKKQPIERTFTHDFDYCSEQSLDYILHFYRKEMPESLEIKPSVAESKIEKFLVEGRLYETLSDHFGVSTVLKVNRGP